MDDRSRDVRLYDGAQHALVLEAMQGLEGSVRWTGEVVELRVGDVVATGSDLTAAFFTLIGKLFVVVRAGVEP